jgi:V/A-type H+-transporting ATPase subunit E
MDGAQVIEKILSDAKAEAQKIKNETDAKLAQKRAEVDKQLDEYRKQTETLAQKAGENARQQVLSTARMELAKEYLAEKTKLLDEVFAEAQRRLDQMADDEYRNLVAKQMLDAVETGDEEVIIDTNEKRIDQSLINQANGAKKWNLQLAAQREPIGGGFILKKGNIKKNCSRSVVLSRIRNELEIELAKTLFA